MFQKRDRGDKRQRDQHMVATELLQVTRRVAICCKMTPSFYCCMLLCHALCYAVLLLELVSYLGTVVH